MSRVDDVSLGVRLLNGRGGEVEVTPDEMHFLNALTDWDFRDLLAKAAESNDVILLPLPPDASTRVKVVRVGQSGL